MESDFEILPFHCLDSLTRPGDLSGLDQAGRSWLTSARSLFVLLQLAIAVVNYRLFYAKYLARELWKSEADAAECAFYSTLWVFFFWPSLFVRRVASFLGRFFARLLWHIHGGLVYGIRRRE